MPNFSPCHAGSGERGENAAKKPVYNESTNECEGIDHTFLPCHVGFGKRGKNTNKTPTYNESTNECCVNKQRS